MFISRPIFEAKFIGLFIVWLGRECLMVGYDSKRRLLSTEHDAVYVLVVVFFIHEQPSHTHTQAF
jgi:hypothetical protein